MYKETFEISFDAQPVFVHANPQVRADSAKVAVLKGPLVYCVEEVDNGENLSSVMVNTDQKIEETYDDELLEGYKRLERLRNPSFFYKIFLFFKKVFQKIADFFASLKKKK